jgi:hypothetical protein
MVDESLVAITTTFHRRSFVAIAIQPGDPPSALATIDMVFGQLLEIVRIATFTQRFSAKQMAFVH